MTQTTTMQGPTQSSYVDQYGVYHAHYDPTGAAKLSTTVIHVLADYFGVDVTDSGFVLNDLIDPDALDTLFGRKGGGDPRVGGHVGFHLWDYEVTVYSDGEITVRPMYPAGQVHPAPSR